MSPAKAETVDVQKGSGVAMALAAGMSRFGLALALDVQRSKASAVEEVQAYLHSLAYPVRREAVSMMDCAVRVASVEVQASSSVVSHLAESS